MQPAGDTASKEPSKDIPVVEKEPPEDIPVVEKEPSEDVIINNKKSNQITKEISSDETSNALNHLIF